MRILLFAPIFAVITASASAQPQNLTLDIKNGRVNLEATAVPARQILAEWARIGGTRIVGGDKVTGAPLTLKLENMPERQALDIILRSVAGYMATPRLATAQPGASGYDRILILATSSTPAPVAAAGARPSNGATAGALDRRVPPRPPMLQATGGEPDNDAADVKDLDQADTGINPQQPVFTFPQPQLPGNQAFVPVPQVGQPALGQPIMLQPNANGQPTIYNFMPVPTAPPPTTGFGVIGAPSPGMIQQPAQQPATAVPPRPPGGQ